MTAVCSHVDVGPALGEAIASLSRVVAAGVPVVVSSKHAVELIDGYEVARRLAAVAAVDLLAGIHVSRAFYEHGHANARVMFEHVAGVSGAESHRLDKIRRMVAEAELIGCVWRAAELSVDKAALLGQAFSNPRTRERFLLDQKWFLKKARRFGMARLNMSTQTRLFTGLTRLGVQLTTTECYWRRSLRSLTEISRLRLETRRDHRLAGRRQDERSESGLPRGGQTNQHNGLPACKRHNRFKERGYTVTRQQDATITITTPNGETVR